MINVVKNISEYSQKLPELATLNTFKKYLDKATNEFIIPVDPKK